MDNRDKYIRDLRIVLEEKISELIVHEDIKRDVTNFLNEVPQEFWACPSSRSGKFHPYFDNYFCGALRHSISVAKFAMRYMDGGKQNLNQLDQDSIIAASFLHDTWICRSRHATRAANNYWEKSKLDPLLKRKICVGIANHMGIFGPIQQPFPVENQKDFYISYVVCNSDTFAAQLDYFDEEMHYWFDIGVKRGVIDYE